MLYVISNIFFSMNLTVVKDGRVNNFPQPEGIHILNIKFRYFSGWTDIDGVINLGNSLDEMLNLDID